MNESSQIDFLEADIRRLKDFIATLRNGKQIYEDNFIDARSAMDLIRREVSQCAPPGSTINPEMLTPEFTIDAEDICRGVHAIYEAWQEAMCRIASLEEKK